MARVLETIEQAIQNAVAQDRRRILRGLRKWEKHYAKAVLMDALAAIQEAITIVEGKT